MTYHMARTVDGIAALKAEPAGYGNGFWHSPCRVDLIECVLTEAPEAPLFLTLQISPKGSRKRPGNTDPRINDVLQEALDKRILSGHSPMGSKYSAKDVEKMMIVANALQESRRKMRVNGDQVRGVPDWTKISY